MNSHSASNPGEVVKITRTRKYTKNQHPSSDSDKVVGWAFMCPALIQRMTVAFSDWSKCRRMFLPLPPETLTLSNHSWIHCHLIIFEEGKDPSRMSGHCVSCPQWGPKIGEAHSCLIMLSEKYQTHPICPTPSAHMLPCFSHASWNCSAVAL